MRRFLSFILVLSLLVAAPAVAENRGAAEAEVLHDFEQILDLWRDGKYAELFEHTTVGGKQSKESFVKALASAPRHPACCWEKMQDVRITVKSGRAAVVRAKLGFEGAVPGVEYVTKGVKLKREDGVWVISQADLFSLASLTKKRARYRYLTVRER